MIKRYNQFISESTQIPGPGKQGSIKINLTDEEALMFNNEPSLEELISNNKVALLTPDLWYNDNDTDTINILKNYFDVSFNETPSTDSPWVAKNESKVNEELTDGSIANHESLICPYCNCEQDEHPENIFQNDFAVYDCDECGKKFDCSRVTEVTYYTKKIKGVE